MKPTVQSPDFYAVGNDYAQGPISAFYDLGQSGENYQDGIYTRLSKDLKGKDAYGKDDPWKDPHGFNKRKVLVNPSASYSADDYAVADVLFNIGETDKEDDHAAGL